MEGALSGIMAVAAIFVLIGAGVFAAWRKWLTPEAARALPRIIVAFGLPCNVVTSLYKNFVAASPAGAAPIAPWLPLAIAFGTLIASFLLAQLAARMLRIPDTRRGVFTVLFSFSNSMFIGFPVAQALFGDAGMTYAVYYYLANTTCFWVVGYLLIRRDADRLRGEALPPQAGEPATGRAAGVLDALKKLVTPPFVTILAMFIVILAKLPLPRFVLTVCEYGGGMTTPLSLIFTGCMIWEAGRKSLRWERGMGAVMLGRFVVNPALCLGACAALFSLMAPVSAEKLGELTLMRNVLAVQMGLPVMTQSVITSQRYGADALYATRGVVWTTLASFVTIPATVLLFQAL